MVNILLEGYDIAAPWLYPALSHYLKPVHKVAVVAFAFRASRVKCEADWAALYGRGEGRLWAGIVGGFAAYGIAEENVSFVDYFTDTAESAAQKIAAADIVYFPGGMPDQMMERIRAFGLYDALVQFDGIVMGYSAGAVIQLAEYHLSPDEDYPAFGYYAGLPYLRDLYLEVHYTGTAEQAASIRRVLAERGKPVYATVRGAGGLIVDDGQIELLGDVRVFGGQKMNEKQEERDEPHM